MRELIFSVIFVLLFMSLVSSDSSTINSSQILTNQEEPNNSFETAIDVVFNETITLFHSHQFGDSDDYFRFELNETKLVTVSTKPELEIGTESCLDTRLFHEKPTGERNIIYLGGVGSECMLLTENFTRILYAGIYYAMVTNSAYFALTEQYFDFTVYTFPYAPNPNQTPETTLDLSENSTQSGFIFYDPLNRTLDEYWYKVNITQNDDYKFNLKTNADHIQANITDEAMNSVYNSIDHFPTGTYYVHISYSPYPLLEPLGRVDGSYFDIDFTTVELDSHEPNNNATNATLLLNLEVFNGNIFSNDTEDWYKWINSESVAIDFTLNIFPGGCNEDDISLIIYFEQTVFAKDNAGPCSGKMLYSYYFEDLGNYYFVLNKSESADPFEYYIELEFKGKDILEDDNSPEFAIDITAPNQIIIERNLHNFDDVDWFQFILEIPRKVTVETFSTNIFTLSLFDSDLNLVETWLHSNNFANSWDLPVGQYYLSVEDPSVIYTEYLMNVYYEDIPTTSSSEPSNSDTDGDEGSKISVLNFQIVLIAISTMFVVRRKVKSY